MLVVSSGLPKPTAPQLPVLPPCAAWKAPHCSWPQRQQSWYRRRPLLLTELLASATRRLPVGSTCVSWKGALLQLPASRTAWRDLLDSTWEKTNGCTNNSRTGQQEFDTGATCRKTSPRDVTRHRDTFSAYATQRAIKRASRWNQPKAQQQKLFRAAQSVGD